MRAVDQPMTHDTVSTWQYDGSGRAQNTDPWRLNSHFVKDNIQGDRLKN